jgi:hypothetical protein
LAGDWRDSRAVDPGSRYRASRVGHFLSQKAAGASARESRDCRAITLERRGLARSKAAEQTGGWRYRHVK